MYSISAKDGSIAMVVVRSIGYEIDLAQELLLMMLKFSHHFYCVGSFRVLLMGKLLDEVEINYFAKQKLS